MVQVIWSDLKCFEIFLQNEILTKKGTKLHYVWDIKPLSEADVTSVDTDW